VCLACRLPEGHRRGAANPVPRGLPSRRESVRPSQPVPLVRGTRRLPQILPPAEVDELTASLRTHRDRAMVAAVVLGGLRRCEVLGLRLEDLRGAERRVFVVDGKGGHQRLVPASRRFLTEVGAYLDLQRPPRLGTEKVFVALADYLDLLAQQAAGRDSHPERAGSTRRAHTTSSGIGGRPTDIRAEVRTAGHRGGETYKLPSRLLSLLTPGCVR
jgi:integrase/recombinase XerD